MTQSPDGATPEQAEAWLKGYQRAADNGTPHFGGLYRGEEPWYMQGYNRYCDEAGLLRWKGPIPDEATREYDPSLLGNQNTKQTSNKGEVRTTSSTGGQKGVKPERYSLIPVESLASIARLYAFGAEKYAAHNWRLGYEWTKSYDSLFRHASASLAGEDYDEESGEPHLAGVVFHAFTLIAFLFDPEKYGQFDDRHKTDVPPKKIEAPAVVEETQYDKNIASLGLDMNTDANGLMSKQLPARIRDMYDAALKAMADYSGGDFDPKEFESDVFNPPLTLDKILGSLADLYDHWSVTTAKELRRAAADILKDASRPKPIFNDFLRDYPVSGITTKTRVRETRAFYPTYRSTTRTITIPQVEGVAYYIEGKHVLGEVTINESVTVESIAIPGYYLPHGEVREWYFVA